MWRGSYDRDEGSRPAAEVKRRGASPGAVVPNRKEEPRRPPQLTPGHPDEREPTPWAKPEPLRQHDVLPLTGATRLRHDGRREDDRRRPRRTREQRVQHVLDLLGTYRVVSRKSIVEHCFDGHPFAASRTLPALERDGLIAARKVWAGRKGYQVSR